MNGGSACNSDASTVALYHFDSNLTTDSGPHGYTLTVHGSPTLANNTTWMNSYPNSGKVARFNSTEDYLQVTTIDPDYILPGDAPSPVTIEAWIYPRAYGGNTDGIVFLSQSYDPGPPATGSQWGLFYTEGLTPNAPAVWANPSIMTGLDNTGWSQGVALNTWHKLVVTFDSIGTTRAYIDGVLASECSSCPPIYDHTTLWTLTIGNFIGDIDEVRISNCVRSPQPACGSCQ